MYWLGNQASFDRFARPTSPFPGSRVRLKPDTTGKKAAPGPKAVVSLTRP